MRSMRFPRGSNAYAVKDGRSYIVEEAADGMVYCTTDTGGEYEFPESALLNDEEWNSKKGGGASGGVNARREISYDRIQKARHYLPAGEKLDATAADKMLAKADRLSPSLLDFLAVTVAERVLTESVFPICSPQAILGNPLDTPADLEHHTLLHDDTMNKVETFPDWTRWLEFAGVPHLATTRGHRFSLSTLAIDATMGGRGVSLGRSGLIETELNEGRLIRPFDLQYPVTHDYFLSYPKDSPSIEPMMAFRDWVIDSGRTHAIQ